MEEYITSILQVKEEARPDTRSSNEMNSASHSLPLAELSINYVVLQTVSNWIIYQVLIVCCRLKLCQAWLFIADKF
jgi:hypothetical protein